MSELDDLRFPIGRFSAPASSMPGVRAAHIHTLGQLSKRLAKAVEGLTDEQLDTPYREGGWTIRQVVHHIADSHANAFMRFKHALTEDCPTIKAYDEAKWAELADSKKLPIAPALAMIDGLHARWVAVLEAMTPDDFHKCFNHPEHGQVGLTKALAMYDWHARHHMAHITGLRGRKGW
jgi:uncharacterized damage-inducible protein DinB